MAAVLRQRSPIVNGDNARDCFRALVGAILTSWGHLSDNAGGVLHRLK